MKHTKEQIANIIQNEGIGYTIQDYVSGEHIEDKVLAEMWKDAKDLLDRISEYIGLR